MPEKIEFIGNNLYLKMLRVTKGVRLEIDVPLTEYGKVAHVPALEDGKNYRVTIEEIEDEVPF